MRPACEREGGRAYNSVPEKPRVPESQRRAVRLLLAQQYEIAEQIWMPYLYRQLARIQEGTFSLHTREQLITQEDFFEKLGVLQERITRTWRWDLVHEARNIFHFLRVNLDPNLKQVQAQLNAGLQAQGFDFVVLKRLRDGRAEVEVHTPTGERRILLTDMRGRLFDDNKAAVNDDQTEVEIPTIIDEAS